MAEQIISPGVFTQENDLSFLPAGIGAIGAAIVGPTVKGPAFIPTVVNSFADYERKFGPLSSETFVPQTVREYLKNAGTVTVCRVLAGGGYSWIGASQSPAILAAGLSGVGASAIESGFIIESYQAGTGVILGVINMSKDSEDSTPNLGKSLIHGSSAPGSTPGTTATPSQGGHSLSGSFKIILSGSGDAGSSPDSTYDIFSASLNPTNDDYLPKQLGYSSDNSKTAVNAYAGIPGYTYINFKDLQTSAIAATAAGAVVKAQGLYPNLSGSSKLTVSKVGGTDIAFEGISSTTEKYSYSSTPWIQSQLLGGDADQSPASKTTKNLFKFHTLSHGTSTNKEYKISIANLREPSDIDGEEQYSTFSVLVRKFSDSDKTPVVLEQYNNCNLNPDSPLYISRVIGDRYPEYNDTLGKVELLGSYPNISNYIRVEVADAVASKATSPKLSPKGFAAISDPIRTDTLVLENYKFPSASYEASQSLGTDFSYSSKGYL